jgi:uncharacterized protein YbaA (DUF1428 family)
MASWNTYAESVEEASLSVTSAMAAAAVSAALGPVFEEFGAARCRGEAGADVPRGDAPAVRKVVVSGWINHCIILPSTL